MKSRLPSLLDDVDVFRKDGIGDLRKLLTSVMLVFVKRGMEGG